MSLDTKELYEIVKDVPMYARPRGLVGWNLERSYPLLCVPTMGDQPTHEDVFISPDHAEMLFEASMIRWLIGEGYHTLKWEPLDEGVVLELYEQWRFEDRSGAHSHVRLLARACIAIDKDNARTLAESTAQASGMGSKEGEG